jgi:hypothetical protein
MTLTDVTTELAARVREEGLAGEHFPIALNLVAQAWHAYDHSGADELRWGMAAGDVLDVTNQLFPKPSDRVVLLDEAIGVTAEEARVSIADLILVLADTLQSTPADDDERAWAYAHASTTLRAAARDLR